MDILEIHFPILIPNTLCLVVFSEVLFIACCKPSNKHLKYTSRHIKVRFRDMHMHGLAEY